jgi:hypothetical protein
VALGLTEEPCRYHPGVAPPILVTGSHRSGTTWVGRMLALDPGVGYIREPFNPDRWPSWMRSRPPHWFEYVCAEDEAAFAPQVRDMLAFRYPIRNLVAARSTGDVRRLVSEYRSSRDFRRRGVRPLLKDPIAVLSSEWLADRFGAEIVLLIRHPAAFASSIKRLDWAFDFRSWTAQPLLLRDLLGPYEAEIRSFAEHERDLIDQSILLWNAIHHVILGYRERHPGWTFLRHEDLCEDPVGGFRGLFEHLGLTWDAATAEAIASSSSDESAKEVPASQRHNVRRDSKAARWTWLKRLTRDEQDRIRAGTAAVAAAFYGPEDWDPGNAPS